MENETAQHIRVSVDTRNPGKPWDVESIVKLACHALRHMEVALPCELSVSLVGLEEIQRLNERYRGVDTYTDVLSFECDDPWTQPEDGSPVQLGDVVMCTDAVDEQRAQFKTSFEQEASLMLVHSILHLLGFDHETPEEREEMEALEKEILDSYGMTGVR